MKKDRAFPVAPNGIRGAIGIPELQVGIPRKYVVRCAVYRDDKSYVDCFNVTLGRASPRASRLKVAAGIGVSLY